MKTTATINEFAGHRVKDWRRQSQGRMDCNRNIYRYYLAGGIWAVAEFYGRIEAVESAVSGNGEASEKLTALGATLETIMENQKELLDMRDRIAEVEKDFRRK